MTDAPTNFDPYLDWDKITEEQAKEMTECLRQLKQAQKNLMFYGTPANVAEVIRLHHEIDSISNSICESIWTIPAMVHVAGAVKEEEGEEYPEGAAAVQRCARCASILHFWHENMGLIGPEGPRRLDYDEVDWWKEGAQVAKSINSTYGGMSVYQIEDRDLEPHEMVCVALPQIEVES